MIRFDGNKERISRASPGCFQGVIKGVIFGFSGWGSEPRFSGICMVKIKKISEPGGQPTTKTTPADALGEFIALLINLWKKSHGLFAKSPNFNSDELNT